MPTSMVKNVMSKAGSSKSPNAKEGVNLVKITKMLGERKKKKMVKNEKV